MAEDLHADVIGPGVEILAHPIEDGCLAAEHDQCIDEAIRTPSAEVVFGEPCRIQLLR